jgi:hypothetical protein
MKSYAVSFVKLADEEANISSHDAFERLTVRWPPTSTEIPPVRNFLMPSVVWSFSEKARSSIVSCRTMQSQHFAIDVSDFAALLVRTKLSFAWFVTAS